MEKKLQKETREFQAETKQILNLMVHSIYTNKEIFLRELLSNASDAIDKVRFESLTNPELTNSKQLEIRIDINEKENCVTISDNGIGMSYQEVIENIGTIAKSGTRAFLEKLKAANSSESDIRMIGQFGVGFYSSFMVADRVVLLTRSAKETSGVRWESAGDGSFSIEETEKEDRGTSITLFLKEEFRDSEKSEENFLNLYTIQNLVKKYSDYVHHPIYMTFPVTEKPKDENNKEIENAEPITRYETRTVNSMKPLWTRPKNEISKEEYSKFYKQTFHDWNEPIDIIHTKAEGMVEYTALIFLPEKAPFDFYQKDRHYGIQLYSRNIFIMNECKDLIPEHLSFAKGLVDSPDFSLNISRELLQHSNQLKIIGANLEKSIVKSLENMRDQDRKKYETFWNEFGKIIKGGIYLGRQNHEKLQDLLLFHSSNSADSMTTLGEYVSRMPESQKEIFYASGRDRQSIEALPQMELVREKGYEVLYLLDRVDEFAIDSLHSYKEKKFKSVSRGNLELDDSQNEEVKKANEQLAKDNEDLLKTIKDFLSGKVSDVRVSNRLKSSAVCLVSGEAGVSIAMENILSEMNQPHNMFRANRVLEINPQHALFSVLQSIHKKDAQSDTLKSYSELLYEQALLIEGLQVENPAAFANRVAQLMVQAPVQ